MAKASEKLLAELHNALAQELISRVKGKTIEGENGEKMTIVASAAELTAAITFLKNNSITADIEDNDELSELKERLAAKRAKREIPAASGPDLDRIMGGGRLM